MNCYICGKPIADERVSYLKEAFYQNSDFTCIDCAAQVVKPYKGLMFGSSGAPELRIVRDVEPCSGIYKPEDKISSTEIYENETEESPV